MKPAVPVVRFSRPTIPSTISKAVGSAPSASWARTRSSSSPAWRAHGRDLHLRVTERFAVAGQAEVDRQRLDRVEARQVFAERIGRVAVVEEEGGAAEQVVAGDEQAPLGLVQADVRGRVAGGLDDAPGADVGLDLDPGDELAVGRRGCRRSGLPACSVRTWR